MGWMMRNSSGKRDAILTMTVWTVIIVLFRTLVSGLTFTLKGHPVSFNSMDAALAGALFGPLLAAYCGRRYTDKKFPDVTDKEEEKSK